MEQFWKVKLLQFIYFAVELLFTTIVKLMLANFLPFSIVWVCFGKGFIYYNGQGNNEFGQNW